MPAQIDLELGALHKGDNTMMFQAIVTKYHGPTNLRGARVSARAEAGRVRVQYDHALNGSDNHKAAAQALVNKLGWTVAAGYPSLVGGALPGNAGYCFVLGGPATLDTQA
jgi:hypothetical protein